ncbi:MAG: hypothetical protein FH749_03595 [Firmicutes bacterium]|nr:hypothetical protein [Bacillota bacterium]
MNFKQNWQGFVGAGLGFVVALITLAGYGEPGTVDGVSTNYYQVIMLSAFSAIALWATLSRESKPGRSGKLLIATAAGGLITAPLYFFPSAMLFLTAGFSALKQEKEQDS